MNLSLITFPRNKETMLKFLKENALSILLNIFLVVTTHYKFISEEGTLYPKYIWISEFATQLGVIVLQPLL